MIKLVMKGRRISWELELRGKYTVICGDSGTGKSSLVNLIFNNRRRLYEFTSSDSTYSIRRSGDDLSELLAYETYVEGKYIFISDDDNSERRREMRMIMKNSKNSYFVFITRNSKIPGLDYGLDDVYKMVEVCGVNKLMKVFDYTVYEQALRELPRETIIVSEDSGTGYTFYSKLFRNNEVRYVSKGGEASGKSYVMRFIGDLDAEGKRDLFLAVDWCSFGEYAISLAAYVSSHPQTHIWLLSYALSFEYVILCCNFFIGRFNDNHIDLSVKSLETFYENLLSELTIKTHLQLVHGRTKTLPRCYYDKCCSIKTSSYYEDFGDCSNKLTGDDKFVALFTGTKFVSLLKLSGRL